MNEQLKVACVQSKMSLIEIAGKSGCSYQTIRHAIQGKAVAEKTAKAIRKTLCKAGIDGADTIFIETKNPGRKIGTKVK